MAETDTYIVDHSLQRDGESYEPGDEIELTEEEAEGLRELDPSPISEPDSVASPAPSSAPEVGELESRIEELETERDELQAAVDQYEDAGDVLLTKTLDELEEAIQDVENVHRLKALKEEDDRAGAQEILTERIEALSDDDGDSEE